MSKEVAEYFEDLGIKPSDIDVEDVKRMCQDRYTIHECTNGKTVQLIPVGMHGAIKHTGGVSLHGDSIPDQLKEIFLRLNIYGH
jgi:hypothetical protein